MVVVVVVVLDSWVVVDGRRVLDSMLSLPDRDLVVMVVVVVATVTVVMLWTLVVEYRVVYNLLLR